MDGPRLRILRARRSTVASPSAGCVSIRRSSRLLVALVVYTASHIAEIVRGSIQAVHRGQDEAARLSRSAGSNGLWFVVLPQAFRVALPPSATSTST